MSHEYYQPPGSDFDAPPPGPFTIGSYVDQRFTVLLLGAGLLGHALLSLGMVGVDLWTYSLVNDVAVGRVSHGALETRDTLATAILQLRSLCYLGTGILTLVYLHRASQNARALGAEGMEYTPGWTVGWWFVPFANWFKPYAVVKELWVASGHGDNAFQIPAAIPVWWGTYVVMTLGGSASSMLFRSQSMDGLATGSIFHATVLIVGVIGAYLAWQVFSGIHTRQRGKAAELGHG
ncbi:MAG: DUF4328 domain-containing protein [Myxococcales bacterium]|nr:DUF4328 domain-containing protein [Myxococcales bacterium]